MPRAMRQSRARCPSFRRASRYTFEAWRCVHSARGMRIGAALLSQVEQFALAGNFKRLVLSTTPFLDRAIQLYEHFGFRRTTEGSNDLFGTPLFTMEKLLSD